MSELFDCDVPNITQHLKQLYDSEELNEEATIKDFLIVQNESNCQVKRKTKFYRLDTVIAVGYRKFRQSGSILSVRYYYFLLEARPVALCRQSANYLLNDKWLFRDL